MDGKQETFHEQVSVVVEQQQFPANDHRWETPGADALEKTFPHYPGHKKTAAGPANPAFKNGLVSAGGPYLGGRAVFRKQRCPFGGAVLVAGVFNGQVFQRKCLRKSRCLYAKKAAGQTLRRTGA